MRKTDRRAHSTSDRLGYCAGKAISTKPKNAGYLCNFGAEKSLIGGDES